MVAGKWWTIGLAVTAPIAVLEAATLSALERMRIEVNGREQTEGGLRITARGRRSDITIELDRLTRQTARIRVDATASLALEDRATAAEIVTQTARVMADRTHGARADRPAAAAAPAVPRIGLLAAALRAPAGATRGA